MAVATVRERKSDRIAHRAGGGLPGACAGWGGGTELLPVVHAGLATKGALVPQGERLLAWRLCTVEPRPTTSADLL